MADLVNIVHPYTIKIFGGELILTPVENFLDRDKKIANFLRKSLDLGIKIVKHNSSSRFYEMMAYGAISLDPIFGNLLMDERMENVSTISSTGLPLENEKPEGMNSLEWGMAKERADLDSHLRDIIGNPSRTFYLGGYFDTCIKNMALHQRRNYTPNGEIFCIEEISILGFPKKEAQTKRELEKSCIWMISYEEAMKMIQENNASRAKNL